MKRKDIILVVVAALFILAGSILGTKKTKVLTEEEQRLVWSTTLSSANVQTGINEMSFDYFEALYNIGEEKTVVYIGSETCSWCKRFKPILEEIAKENNLKIVYINVANLSRSEKNELITASENHFTGGTPTTLVMEKGKVLDSLGGYVEKDKAIEFFKSVEMIG